MADTGCENDGTAAAASAAASGSSTLHVLEIDPESTASAGAGAGGVASVAVGGMESSSSAEEEALQDRVTRYSRWVNNGVCFLSVFGFVLFLIGSSIRAAGDGNADADILVTAGSVLFLLPFLCWGLFILGAIMGVMLLGIRTVVRGTRGVSLVKAVTGLIITTHSSIVLAAIVDIALYASDIMMLFDSLMFSVPFVGFIIMSVYQIVRAITMACIKRWGIILQAKVHERRRHRTSRKDDNGRFIYMHLLLVRYDIEGLHQHQPCGRVFGYQRVSSSTTDASPVDEDEQDQMEMEVVECEESNRYLCLHHSQTLYEGLPVQPALAQEPEETDNNATSYTRQCIQKWLTVSESQYGSSNDFVEVSVLPSWPQISVATETLSQELRHDECRFTAFYIAFTVGAAVLFWLMGAIDRVREMIFEDEDILWHVKASYVVVSILLPTLPLSVYGMVLLEASGSHAHVPNESSQELPMVQQSMPRGSVAEDDDDETARATTSSLFMEG